MRSSLCATRSTDAISRRYHTVPVNLLLVIITQLSVDWFLRGRNEAAGNYSETNRFHSWFVTTFASSFLLFFSLSLCFSFLFLIVSLFFSIFLFLGWDSLVWSGEVLFFFSLEIFFRTRSLFSPFSFLPSSRRLICIHEKSAAVSRVKIYLSVGEEGVCDGCV